MPMSLVILRWLVNENLETNAVTVDATSAGAAMHARPVSCTEIGAGATRSPQGAAMNSLRSGRAACSAFRPAIGVASAPVEVGRRLATDFVGTRRSRVLLSRDRRRRRMASCSDRCDNKAADRSRIGNATPLLVREANCPSKTPLCAERFAAHGSNHRVAPMHRATIVPEPDKDVADFPMRVHVMPSSRVWCHSSSRKASDSSTGKPTTAAFSRRPRYRYGRCVRESGFRCGR